jgi:hypothetical protein
MTACWGEWAVLTITPMVTRRARPIGRQIPWRKLLRDDSQQDRADAACFRSMCCPRGRKVLYAQARRCVTRKPIEPSVEASQLALIFDPNSPWINTKSFRHASIGKVRLGLFRSFHHPGFALRGLLLRFSPWQSRPYRHNSPIWYFCASLQGWCDRGARRILRSQHNSYDRTNPTKS